MKNLVIPVILVSLVGGFLLLRTLGTGGVAPKPAVFAAMGFEQAQTSAQTGGKLLLVKVSADWCPPCQAMNRDTFVDAGVVDWLTANAVTIEVDADREGELARELGVQALPTLIAFRGGREVSRREGYLNGGELIDWLKAAPAEAPANAGG